jgi:pimeloyl-ACP methyl ester carboxylesterase
MSDSYLDPLIAEFDDAYRVSTYAQRGVPPSSAGTPFDLATQSADAVAVLDALGWHRATVLGHSWGGHLLLHALADSPDRLTAAVFCDAIGAVGDGGLEAFSEQMLSRLPPPARARVEALEGLADLRPLTDDEALEQLATVWPSYFASPEAAPPFAPVALSAAANGGGFDALLDALPDLPGRISGSRVPSLFLHGAGGPVPAAAARDTAAAMGGSARVHEIQGAGHFPWLERPGVIRAMVDELLSTAA